MAESWVGRKGTGSTELVKVCYILGLPQGDKFEVHREGFQAVLSGNSGRLRLHTGAILGPKCCSVQRGREIFFTFSRNTVWLWHIEGPRDTVLLGILGLAVLRIPGDRRGINGGINVNGRMRPSPDCLG